MSFKRPLCGPAPVVVFFEAPEASKSLISRLVSGFIDREVEALRTASDVVCVGCSPSPAGIEVDVGAAIGWADLGFEAEPKMQRCRSYGKGIGRMNGCVDFQVFDEDVCSMLGPLCLVQWMLRCNSVRR
jgi:hypothetical protein